MSAEPLQEHRKLFDGYWQWMTELSGVRADCSLVGESRSGNIGGHAGGRSGKIEPGTDQARNMWAPVFLPCGNIRRSPYRCIRAAAYLENRCIGRTYTA